MLEEGQILQKFGLEPASLAALSRERLVTREPRHESVFYEISHDRLAGTIHQCRKFRIPRGLQLALASTLLVAVVAAVLAVREKARAEEEVRRAEAAEKLIGFMMSDLYAKLQPIARLSLLDDVNKTSTNYLDSLPVKKKARTCRVGQGVMLNNEGDVLRAGGNLRSGTYELPDMP